jgi:hypothetical protein
MAGFRNVTAYVQAFDDGKVKLSTWRKSPSQATTAGVWFDLSMSPGNPVPNYYASSPYVSATLNGNEGIFHGGAVTPGTKRIKNLMALTAVSTALPMNMILSDYLMYYPFLDMGTNDDQPMTNSATLPRYTDGEGVQVIAVMTNPQVAGGATFNFDYTNQDGTSGRTSRTVTCNTATAIGGLINTASATAGASSPFIPLADGDTGVRSIETFRMVAGSDVGLICLVLVKPLARIMIRGIDAPTEVDFLVNAPSLPEVKDGAYLNYLALPNGTLAATPIHGTAEFIWS